MPLFKIYVLFNLKSNSSWLLLLLNNNVKNVSYSIHVTQHILSQWWLLWIQIHSVCLLITYIPHDCYNFFSYLLYWCLLLFHTICMLYVVMVCSPLVASVVNVISSFFNLESSKLFVHVHSHTPQTKSFMDIWHLLPKIINRTYCNRITNCYICTHAGRATICIHL